MFLTHPPAGWRIHYESLLRPSSRAFGDFNEAVPRKGLPIREKAIDSLRDCIAEVISTAAFLYRSSMKNTKLDFRGAVYDDLVARIGR
jgi:hypothetical protein